MSVLGDVFGSLRSMSLLQLLLAFVACAGYAFAQGSLLPERARRYAWLAAFAAAVGFAAESQDWTLATMLIGFAVAGLGSFVVLVWAMCRALGLGTRDAVRAPESAFLDSSLPASPETSATRARAPQPTGPAHFV